jgi:hypothetical protein
LLRHLGRCGHKRAEGGWPEDALAAVALSDFASTSTQQSCRKPQIIWRWLIGNLEEIQQTGDQIVTPIVVNQWIAALVVAQRLVETIGSRVKDDDLVRAPREPGSAGQAKLEWHVEPGGAADTRKVVDRDLAGAEKLVEPD